MAAAAAAAAEGELDQVMVRAAQILVSLRSRKLRAWPMWVPKPEGEESESSPGTAPAVEVPAGWLVRRPRSRGRRGSCAPWMKALREMELAGSGGEETDAAAAAAAGSGSPSTSSAGRAAPTQPPPNHAVEKALAAATAAAAAAKEPMTASSPNTPLDYGAGGSRASSSADDAARPRAKRKGPGSRGSGGGEDDEGCSSPAKRTRAAADEVKPIPTEQSMQIETSATSAKGFAFDLNFPPPSDDGTCPDAC